VLSTRNIIRTMSFAMILLGMIHIYFAGCRTMDIDTLWFIGSGFAIIFPGLLNLIAIHKGYSRFAYLLAFITNALVCALFCFSLSLMHGPQVYIGITLFLITSLAFLIAMFKAA
jgi:hypothetical protein